MVSLSSLAKTILLTHIHRFHSCLPLCSSRLSRSPVGRPRRLSFPYILDRILFKPEDALFNGLALHGLKKSKKQSKCGFSSLINDFCDNELIWYPEIVMRVEI